MSISKLDRIDSSLQQLFRYNIFCATHLVVVVAGATVFKWPKDPSGFLYTNFVELHNLGGLRDPIPPMGSPGAEARAVSLAFLA